MSRVAARLCLPLLAAAVISAQPTVPTPASSLGFEPCADYKLATYEPIAAYFRTLAAAAPCRMQLFEIGKTAEGRTEIMAIISSESNMRQLARFKDIARRLALARPSTSSGRPEALAGRDADDAQ